MMMCKTLAGVAAVLLAGTAAASAQTVYVTEPAYAEPPIVSAPVIAAPGYVVSDPGYVVAPAPGYVQHDYGYTTRVPAYGYYNTTYVEPRTCSTDFFGNQYCD
jgi:hypothetical protein